MRLCLLPFRPRPYILFLNRSSKVWRWSLFTKLTLIRLQNVLLHLSQQRHPQSQVWMQKPDEGSAKSSPETIGLLACNSIFCVTLVAVEVTNESPTKRITMQLHLKSASMPRFFTSMRMNLLPFLSHQAPLCHFPRTSCSLTSRALSPHELQQWGVYCSVMLPARYALLSASAREVTFPRLLLPPQSGTTRNCRLAYKSVVS